MDQHTGTFDRSRTPLPRLTELRPDEPQRHRIRVRPSFVRLTREAMTRARASDRTPKVRPTP